MGPEIRSEVTERAGRTVAPHRRYLPDPARTAATPVRRARGWLSPGEPETCRRDVRWFLAIWCQLALLVAIIKVYRLEGRALLLLGAISLLALPIHYALPFRWKKPFFLLTSLGGLAAVFGAVPALAVPTGAATLLITGDSLFPGGVGSTGRDPERFAQLFGDVRERIFGRFEDETWVYPGHRKDTRLGVERPQLEEWRSRGW